MKKIYQLILCTIVVAALAVSCDSGSATLDFNSITADANKKYKAMETEIADSMATVCEENMKKNAMAASDSIMKARKSK